jgi:antitoxin VapB
MKSTTLFKSGNSQAMRIPKELRFSGDKVYIEKIGSIGIIVEDGSPWAALKLAQMLISKDFFATGRDVNEVKERKEVERLLKLK